MIKQNKEFDREKVLGGYRLDDFMAMYRRPLSSLIDIIPSIDRNSSGEMEILGSWENYFESLDVPFAITTHTTYQAQRTITYYSLWKERRV